MSIALAHAGIPAGNENVSASYADRFNDCFALTKNVVEATLLERILFWHPHAQHTDRQGRRWLIRCADEFQRDGCPWHIKTIRAALRRLVKKGLIVIQHSWHRFRRDTFKPHSSYILPNLKGSDALPLKGTEDSLSLSVSSKQDIVTCAPTAHETQADENENSKVPALEESSALSTVSPMQQDDPPAKKTTASIMAAFKTKKAPRADLSKPLNADRLHKEIRHWHLETFPNEVPPAPSTKRLSWLKGYMAKARELECTDAMIIEQVRLVVSNYFEFRDYIKARTGWTLPERPTHLMFVQQAGEIMNFVSHFAPVAAAAEDAPKPGTIKHKNQKA